MAKTSVRITGGDVQMAALFPEAFDDRARSAAFAAFAREQIKYADEVNRQVLGRVPVKETYVDGRKETRLESVRPDGQIVAEYQLLEEVLAHIRSELIKFSPVGMVNDSRPGHPRAYQASHILVVDGRVYRDRELLPVVFDDAFFASSVPYARKIEGGQSLQAPDGVYEAVAMRAQRRYGNAAKISFSWRSISTGQLADWAQSPSARALASSRRGGNPTSHQDWLTRQPAVTIRPR